MRAAILLVLLCGGIFADDRQLGGLFGLFGGSGGKGGGLFGGKNGFMGGKGAQGGKNGLFGLFGGNNGFNGGKGKQGGKNGLTGFFGGNGGKGGKDGLTGFFGGNGGKGGKNGLTGFFGGNAGKGGKNGFFGGKGGKGRSLLERHGKHGKDGKHGKHGKHGKGGNSLTGGLDNILSALSGGDLLSQVLSTLINFAGAVAAGTAALSAISTIFPTTTVTKAATIPNPTTDLMGFLSSQPITDLIQGLINGDLAAVFSAITTLAGSLVLQLITGA